jgi:hypothetical protein
MKVRTQLGILIFAAVLAGVMLTTMLFYIYDGLQL